MTTIAFLWGGAISPFPAKLGQILSLRDSSKGPEMGMEGEYTSPTIPTQQLVPRDFSRHGQGPLQTLSQEGHRESQVQQIHEQTFLSPQETFRGNEDHSGPISPEPIHTNCLIQDDYLERSETPATTRSLDNLH